MRSFLLKNKKPLIAWGSIPQNTYFNLSSGIPKGCSLAISPSDNYIVLDVDKHEGGVNGFDNLPDHLLLQLSEHFQYNTKNNGRHYWLRYTGNKTLMNKASGLGCDLRIANKGYVVFYPKGDIRDYIHLVKETSPELNEWLEKLFCQGKLLKSQ